MQKQNGFGIVLAIAIVAVVGVLAIAAWRVWDANQQPKQNQTADTSQPATGTEQLQTTANPNDGYIIVKEWGVRFKSTEGLDFVVYAINDKASPAEVRFSTTALSRYGDGCSASATGNAPFGVLTRTTSPKEEFGSTSGAFVKHIGDYYYQYTTPQSRCSAQANAAADELQTKELMFFKASIITLEAIQ